MNVLVLGGSGMLGQDVVAELKRRGHDVSAPSSREIDLTDPQSVAQITLLGRFEWCVNCAAYTAVDKAEDEEQNAAELNAMGPGYLARVCGMSGIKLIHISTDFVFDGAATEPYQEDASTRPLGVYGKTKLLGEEAIQAALPIAVIVRTAWLFGAKGKSFPRTMIGAWKAGKTLKVVADQVGCPTYTGDLARTIVDATESNLFPGIYHAVGPDSMSWHAFALKAIEAYRSHHDLSQPVEIEPILTEQWPTPATRPLYSVLSTAKLQAAGIAPMRHLDAALAEFVAQLDD